MNRTVIMYAIKDFLVTHVHFGPMPGSTCLVPGLIYTRFNFYNWISFKSQSAFLYLQEYVGRRYREYYPAASQ